MTSPPPPPLYLKWASSIVVKYREKVGGIVLVTGDWNRQETNRKVDRYRLFSLCYRLMTQGSSSAYRKKTQVSWCTPYIITASSLARERQLHACLKTHDSTPRRACSMRVFVCVAALLTFLLSESIMAEGPITLGVLVLHCFAYWWACPFALRFGFVTTVVYIIALLECQSVHVAISTSCFRRHPCGVMHTFFLFRIKRKMAKVAVRRSAATLVGEADELCLTHFMTHTWSQEMKITRGKEQKGCGVMFRVSVCTPTTWVQVPFSWILLLCFF